MEIIKLSLLDAICLFRIKSKTNIDTFTLLQAIMFMKMLEPLFEEVSHLMGYYGAGSLIEEWDTNGGYNLLTKELSRNEMISININPKTKEPTFKFKPNHNDFISQYINCKTAQNKYYYELYNKYTGIDKEKLKTIINIGDFVFGGKTFD